MAIEIKVPDIGADEVEITEILVKVGDKVEAEQSLITVEGDKASMEVPSPQAGIVKEIKVSSRRQNRDWQTDHDFRFRRGCSSRCTCAGRESGCSGTGTGSSAGGKRSERSSRTGYRRR